jgi:DNA-binding winged helix-turn-helix (wHTH) protein
MKDKRLPRPGETILDLARGTLHRGGRLVMLRPKTFEILAFLAGKAGQVVGKEELLQGVWPGLAVTEDSITQGIRDVRRSLAEEGPAIIRTVPRRGYLFELPETGFRLVSAEPQAIAETGQAMAEPKVAVLAFHLSVGVQDRRGLFDEVANRIAAALCCFRTVSVLEAPAAAALAQTPPEAMQSALAQAGLPGGRPGRARRGWLRCRHRLVRYLVGATAVDTAFLLSAR